jgi:hypothetical protein
MPQPTLEERVATLEQELKHVKDQLASQKPPKDWLDTFGAFANDPGFDEMVREGRAYREAENKASSP